MKKTRQGNLVELNSTDGLESANPHQKESAMLKWALIMAIVALVAGLFGFTDLAAASAGVAKFLFGLFLVLCLIFLVLGMRAAKGP